MVRNVNNTEKNFAQRMEKHRDELRWLYMELYGNDAMYAELCEQMHDYYSKRSTELKKRDIKKEKNPDWFKEKEMLLPENIHCIQRTLHNNFLCLLSFLFLQGSSSDCTDDWRFL